MTYLEHIKEIYKMMDDNKLMEAFEKYYHEDVVKIEATGETTKGKAENAEALKKWFQGIKEYHGSGVDAFTTNEEAKVTMVETWTDVTFQDGSRVKMEQVAVQYWEADKIIKERFYYNSPN